MIQEGGRIAARNEYTFAGSSLVLPDHGHAVGGVLTRDADPSGQAAGSDLFQADQAYSRDGVTLVQLRPKGGRQLALHHFGATRKFTRMRRRMTPWITGSLISGHRFAAARQPRRSGP
jgi:hypothetical protein